MRWLVCNVGTLIILLAGTAGFAQEPCPCAPPPATPPIWTGSLNFGFGLTSGNSDTRNLNFAFDIMRDAKTKHVFKANALYLWSSLEGEDTANRLGFDAREEYKLSERAFLFAQGQYLRDPFKAIDYLIAPTGGIGYKVVDTDQLKFSVDGGGGATWEKNPGLDVRTYGAITAGEDLKYAISKTASLTHSAAALWKADDFGDALYTIGAALSASLTTRTTMKFGVLDTYKSKPPDATIQKNDVAVLLSLGYKF